ncbi:MerR family transcriptional regulator [Isoalcanivorax pacificus]|jgi:DNA-binding transcriptional MerR regulator|nr:MerR family transcriptional regulator [Isoalcanivorax pacificus]
MNLRMAELVRRSGVSRETIHYYLREGLLPRPQKTARNTALYGEEHVQRLTLIRSLRDEHLLSLKAIKGLLADQTQLSFTPDQLATLARLRRHKLGNQTADADNSLRTEQLADELALSDAELAELRAGHFLSADDNEIADQDEAETLRLWALLRNAGLTPARGFSPRDMAYINQAADLLFQQEVTFFQQRLHNLSEKETDALLHTVIPAINRLVSLRHERKIAALLESYATASDAAAHATPSESSEEPHHG